MSGADGHRNHVGGNRFAEPHAGIEAGRDRVDQRIVDGDLDMDVGKAFEEARHQRQQHQLRRLPRGIDAQRAGRLAAKIVQVFQRIVDIAERRADPREQPLARLRQRDAARGAVDQPQIEPLLDMAQRVAERRGRDAKLGRRRAKTAVSGDGKEGGEVGGVDPH